MPRLKMTIEGRVQGVRYRKTCKEIADQLKLSGWVMNLPNGHVELEAQGSEDSLARFRSWCKRGPVLSQVTKVTETPIEEIKGMIGFKIRND